MQFERNNIFKQLEQEFKIYDSVFDVGCRGLFDLVTFEDSNFKRLIGISKESVRGSHWGDYLNRKKEILGLKEEELSKRVNEFYEKFIERYLISDCSVLNYNFEKNEHGMIICNKVLHFFEDNVKLELIEKFINALKKGGLIFIKLNHIHHANNINPLLSIRIDKYIYQSIQNPSERRCLIEPEEFLNLLRPNYNILSQHILIDEKTLTFVIRK